MIRSMTGFGRAVSSNMHWQCTVELRSVNGRYLEVRLRLPAGLSGFQDALRKVVRGYCERGNVEGTITLTPTDDAPPSIRVNQGLLAQYADVVRAAEQQLGRQISISLGDLLGARDLVGSRSLADDGDEIESLMTKTLAEACGAMVKMREEEGLGLRTALLDYSAALAKAAEEVSERTRELPASYAKTLRERLGKLGGGVLPGEERIHQEIAILADRSDVTEELARISTHIEHMEQILMEGGPVGRKLEFLLQEFNREINTLSVKSSDSKVSDVVIELKSDMEKIREQIQNIE